jgi:uncharacterized membrane protein YjgN (DUF898 family)
MKTSNAKLRYHGEGGALFGLMIVNAVLSILTLGVYSFWAKNKVREFHYSHTSLDGDRFAYHGTGGELFKGALKAGLIFAILGVGMAATTEAARRGVLPAATTLAIVPAFYLALLFLMIVAVNGARRYRLSRSSWRSIRFSFHGRWPQFLGMMVLGTFLTVVTLGFYTPWFQSERRAFLVRNTRFGSEPFMYDGKGKALLGQYVQALLLTLPTLGLSWIWYGAFKHRYLWGHTSMRGARFRSSLTGGQLFSLLLTNTLLVLFTFGLAMPWAIARAHRLWLNTLSLHGTVDWATIEQRAQAASATSEGLAAGLDVDIGIGA